EANILSIHIYIVYKYRLQLIFAMAFTNWLPQIVNSGTSVNTVSIEAALGHKNKDATWF
ncbi:hypothetical protein ACJX0J_008995, partial [Zea mays]